MEETNNTRQAAWVAIGSLCSFTFGIVSSMILSRYFDKVDYGTYKQVLYVYNSLLTVFTLGLPKAFSYFLPRSPLNEAKSLIRKITNLFFLLGGCLSLLLFGAAGFIADFLNNPQLERALRIFSPVPLLMLPTMGLEGILSTYRQTKFLAAYTVLTRLVMLLCVALPVVLFDLNCEGALIGFNIGSLFACVLALWLKYYPVRKEKNDRTIITYGDIFRFALPLLFASIWGMLINSTDQFFISRYFGTEVFAEFSNGAMELPFVGMIIGACSTVLTPLFSKLSCDRNRFSEEVRPIWLSVFEKSAMLIYPIVIFCFFDAVDIMVFMYGQGYVESATFFRIKLFTYVVKIIMFYPVLVALGATKFYARAHMWTFVCLVIVEYMAIRMFMDPLLITGVHVICVCVMNIMFLLYVAKRMHLKISELIPYGSLFKTLLSSILTVCMISFLKMNVYIDVLLIRLGLDLLLFVVLHLSISRLLRNDYWKIIKPLLIR